MNTTLDQVLALTPIMSDPGQNKKSKKYQPGTEVSYNLKENLYVKATIKALKNTSGNENIGDILLHDKNNKVFIEYHMNLYGEEETVSEEVDLDKITLPFEIGTVVYFDKPLHCSTCGLKLCLSNCDFTGKGTVQDVLFVEVLDSWKYLVRYDNKLIKKNQNELRTTELELTQFEYH